MTDFQRVTYDNYPFRSPVSLSTVSWILVYNLFKTFGRLPYSPELEQFCIESFYPKFSIPKIITSSKNKQPLFSSFEKFPKKPQRTRKTENANPVF